MSDSPTLTLADPVLVVSAMSDGMVKLDVKSGYLTTVTMGLDVGQAKELASMLLIAVDRIEDAPYTCGGYPADSSCSCECASCPLDQQPCGCPCPDHLQPEDPA